MKLEKLERLIIKLDKAEDELYQYGAKEIKETIEKLEAEHRIKPGCDNILYVIYEGVCNELGD